MRSSIAQRFPDTQCFVVPVNDRPEGYDYPPEVRFEVVEQDLDSYRRAADFLNFANVDVVCVACGVAGVSGCVDPSARGAVAASGDEGVVMGAFRG